MVSIRKRSWITANGDAKSAWLVDYRDNSGKRRFKQFVRKKDAEAWRIETTHQVTQGTHTPDSQSITVNNAGQMWLRRCRTDNLEPTTIASYEQHLRLHIDPLCGNQRLNQLTTPIVEGYRDKLVGNLSRPMALRVLRSLKAIINEAQRRGLVAQNVALTVKIPRKKREASKVEIPSKGELSKILITAESYPDPKVHSIASLAVFGGLRASELRGLEWAAVDLDRATVTISQRADAAGRIGAPKSKAGHRTIPLPSMAVSALKKWKLACKPGGLVFPSQRGKILSHRVLSGSMMGPVQISAGVVDENGQAKYGLHAFRHAAASLWIEQNVTPKRIQTWLGHSSIQVTFDTYGHLFDQARLDNSVANAVEASLFSNAT